MHHLDWQARYIKLQFMCLNYWGRAYGRSSRMRSKVLLRHPRNLAYSGLWSPNVLWGLRYQSDGHCDVKMSGRTLHAGCLERLLGQSGVVASVSARGCGHSPYDLVKDGLHARLT